MGNNNNYHITSHQHGWQVKGAGNTKASKITSTQQEAVQHGKTLANNKNSELIIHGKNGRIRDKHSYGNDPYPPQG